MRKYSLLTASILSLGIVVFQGCQKETKDQLVESESELLSRNGRDHEHEKNKCRVTLFDFYDGIADVHQYDTYSYKNGRVDEWAVWYGGVYKMEYDHRGKLKKSRYYVDDVLVYTIHFLYKNDKVVKEIWYVGDTKEVDEEVVYTFDRKGQIIRAKSTIGDYYTDNVYTANGDLASWKLYVAGSPVVSGHYTYYKHYKSPFVEGTPGINYNFPYTNSTFGYSKWWYSSEKIINYDENGNPSVYYDQDPRQTKWRIGANNYPTYIEFVDKLSGTHLSVGFEFENCGRNNEGNHHQSNGVTANRNVSASKSNSIRFIFSGPGNKLKERLNEFRKELSKRSKN